MNWFDNRELLIATQHGKEKVIAPLMEQAFSLFCATSPLLDTDAFGTFSGEIDRKSNPLETARLKGLEAARLSNADLIISSEGSFGPHPQLFFLPINQELLLLQDIKNGFEIYVIESSTETNFASETIQHERALLEFAKRIGFPDHAVILKDKASNFKSCVKGIQDDQKLTETFRVMQAQFGSVHAESDMRAHLNPTRMMVIKRACLNLVQKMQTVCPSCTLPGFGIVSFVPGLPCAMCGSPTRLPLEKEVSCTHCSYKDTLPFPDGKTSDPGNCDTCNP